MASPTLPTDAAPPSIAQALHQAAQAGVARLDAQLLLLHVLARGDDRGWLISHDDTRLDAAQAQRYAGALQRRLSGEPVAYIVGHKEFFGLDLQVDARVLVPRPDTETLVEWALQVLPAPSAHPLHAAPRLIDLGTGSGAIALALRRQRPDAEVHALDASEAALQVARANAERLALPLHLWQGNWLDGHPADPRYALIVSNPPYITEHDPHLPALAFEPRQALTAGTDGLDDIRLIVHQARRHLQAGAWLLLEHGWDQAEAVRQILAQAGYAEVQSRRDLAGIERCSGARLLTDAG